MKLLKRFGILLLALLCALPLFSSCQKETEEEETVYYTVTFNSNGGSAVEKQIVAAEEAVLEPTPPTREGYVFEGWRKDTTGSFWDFDAEFVTSDMTLTASWIGAERIFGYETLPEGGAMITSLKQPYEALDIPSIIAGYTVTAIGDGVFSGLSFKKVQSIKLPHTITSVGEEAFYQCRDISIVFDPRAELTEIGESAFFECNLLASVRLGEGLTEIAPWTFFKCSSLREIRLPKSVVSVSDSAFANCTSLRSIMLHPAISEIQDAAFDHCTSLSVLYFYGTQNELNLLLANTAAQNDAFYDATVYFYSESERSGNYWYLDANNNPQCW